MAPSGRRSARHAPLASTELVVSKMFALDSATLRPDHNLVIGRRGHSGALLGTAPAGPRTVPGSQRMARYKITDYLQSASAGRHAADGDRPRSGGSIDEPDALSSAPLVLTYSTGLSPTNDHEQPSSNPPPLPFCFH